jgi:prophage DNA circulation protein
MTIGRRGTLHQFPFKDVPFAEDVGRQARTFTISAFVDGDDYIAKRDALIQALENLSTPGTLVLPTLGSIRVKPTASNTVSYSNRLGGIEIFQLQFEESGLNEFPQATTNTKETAEDRGQTLEDNVITDAGAGINFEPTLADSTELIADPDSLANDSITIVDRFNESIQIVLDTGIQTGDVIDEFSRNFINYRADARSSLLAPESFLSETAALYSQLTEVWQDGALSDAYEALRDVFNSSMEDLATIISLDNPARETQDKNNQLLQDGLRNLLMRQTSDVTVAQTYISTNEVRDRRNSILELFEQQIENAGNAGDQRQRDDLVDLRSAVVADLEQKQGGLPDEVEVNLNDTVPSFTLANDLYGEGLRGREIADTNGVINPLFLPQQDPLNVLSA